MFQKSPLTHSQVGTPGHEQTQWDYAIQGHPLRPRAPPIISTNILAPPNTPPPSGARIYADWCRTVPIRLPQTLSSAMKPGASNEPCPSYDTKSDPAPPYTRLNERPETLARYLFRYGFLCPIFWVIGAAILFCDLNPLPRAIGDKSTADQAEELAIIRASELMWARRSLCAIIVLGAVAGSMVYALFVTGSGPFAP